MFRRGLTTMADYIPRPCVFCGPSGSGKSTLIKKLMDEHQDTFGFSVSHTTRNPRPGEQDGVDYHYTTREKMEKAIADGEFLESAQFSGNLYGTSKKAVQDVLAAQRICILDIEVQGVMSIKKTDLKPIYIFVKPPSIAVLEERLRGRQTDSEEAIQKRLTTAIKEMEYINDETSSNSTFIVVNEDKEVTYEQIKGILSTDIVNLRDIRYKAK
ncbi:guanylate kinase isoform X2 [Strongylocentrotus purpuratus]|uniref:guanylate kinase n=1 Tax=Strongylocentrotus purpuratus TaxID=7668 RepID=A0A7M7N1N0_STRPU|nr:guanylate kinase isoform X2 [Strongylocentrotus purpuratus]